MSKNLHDLSDEEFDDLFRDSAEKSDIGFDPEAWNKMSQKLDAASKPLPSPDKGGNPLTRWILPAIIVLLLLITGTYFFLRKPTGAVTETKVKTKGNSVKQTDNVEEKYVPTDKVDTENQEHKKDITPLRNKAQTDKTVASGSKKEAEKSKETGNSANNKTIGAEKPASLKIRQNQERVKANLATKKQPDIQNQTLSSEIHQKAKINSSGIKGTAPKNQNADNSTENSVKKAKKVITRNKTEANSQLFASSEKTENRTNITVKSDKQSSVLKNKESSHTQRASIKAENSSSVKIADGDLKTINQNQSLGVDSAYIITKMQWTPVHALMPTKHLSQINLKLPNINFESPALTTVATSRANTAFRRGLNIRLALSPDFSFIPSNKIFKIGNNWAAILEYRFNNRVSLQTGVIRSMKYYGALPNQYEWNAYWTMPSPLKDIDATCKMLDIPLNLRYDISQKPNSRWFVGGGFTSYIMLKEEYRYNYENPYDPNIKRKSWEGKTGAYPFSVLNVSVGYERQFFRRLTFQAEPFYKAPLGKVGYGKVRLATAGVFFSVKYPF
jgi:hypothetical protein